MTAEATEASVSVGTGEHETVVTEAAPPDSAHPTSEEHDVAELASEPSEVAQSATELHIEQPETHDVAEPVLPHSTQAPKRDAADLERQKRARAAAIAAAARAAPGQRERVMNEAIAAAAASAPNAVATQQSPQIAKPDDSKAQAVVRDSAYEAPDWAEPPPDTEGVSLDVLKTVLQFQHNAVYLVDLGSTHGTTLNHKQLKPFLYHRVHVGAQFKLGQSTRAYIFNAPENDHKTASEGLAALQEWQQPEGPSREQRRRTKLEKAMQAKIAADAARDRAAAEKSMHEAIHGGADAELAMEGDLGDDTPIDWRAKMTSGTGLTDKQMKLAEAIRSREYKLQKCEEASRKIKVKESAGSDLTAGQAAALLANEKATDKIQEELEELEDTMQISLRDSEAGRQATEVGKERQEKRRRAQLQESSDSDDEFYDRTKRAAKPAKSSAVLTVKTICIKLQTQEQEAAALHKELQALLQESEAAMKNADVGMAEDVLDSFMTNMEVRDSVDKVKKLQFEIRLTEEQLSQTKQLLDVADPSKEHRSRFLQAPQQSADAGVC